MKRPGREKCASLDGKSIGIKLSFVLAFLTAGCAVQAPYPLGIQGKPHVTIAIEPASISAPVKQLADIESPRHADREESNERRLHQDLETIRSKADASAKTRLSQRRYVRSLNIAESTSLVATISRAKAQGADLLLAIDISGYGQIKRKWILLLFGSGVIEGLTQGLAVADATGNPMLGAGVGAEEVASEGLTWIGGSWFWGKYFAPVTIEGRMWRVRDGRLIWRDIRYADNSEVIWKLIAGKKLPKKEQALTASMKEAEEELVGDLDRYVQKQILFHRKRHN